MILPTKFLSDVLPQQGSRVFAFILPGPPGQRPTVQLDQHPGHPDADVARFADWAIAKGADSYVAIGGYGPLTRTITNGKNAGQTRVSRTAQNAQWHRSLRLDIDCGTGKPYATRQDAWQVLKAFIVAHGLPLPTLVNSGGGLHAYFLLDQDVDVATWARLAAMLVNACRANGLQVDPTTTEDAARILRLPGTWNFKTVPALEVKVVIDGHAASPSLYDAALSKYALLGGVAGPIAGTRPTALHNANAAFSANLHPPYHLRGILLGCPGMIAKMQDQGANDSEPLWHATLAMVNKSADPIDKQEKVARHLSQGHPSFDEGAFQAKWGQVQAQDYEPPTCEKMAHLGMPECARCPLRATHRSPVVLGRTAPAAPSQDAQAAVPLQVAPVVHAPPMAALQAAPLPAPVTPTTHGIFQITPGVAQVQIVDGQLSRFLSIHNGVPTAVKMVPGAPGQGATPVNHYIGHYQLLMVERLLDTEGKMALVALTFNRHTDGHVRLELDHGALSEPRAFHQKLAAAGLHYTSEQVKTLQDKFMPEFLSQLQRIRQANAIAGRCGWTPGFDKFVLGTTLFSPASAESIRPSAAVEEMEAYHASGDEALWASAFNEVLSGGYDRQAIVALGIAAPLMAFSGVDGALVNAYSPDSGVGKSTLCDAILSIWGAPDKLRKDFRDTSAATFHLASVSGNLPMVIDEFTNVDGKDLSSYIYTITQGRERHRLGADSKIKENKNRWCMPWIATSNLSVHAKLQNYRQDSMAEAARVFEMRLYPLAIDPALMGAAKARIDAIETNYGFLGPKLVQLFMAKGEAYWRDKVMKRVAWWDQTMASDTSDRFRSVIAALIEIGAILGKALGYNFDPVQIVGTVQQHWRTQVAEYEMSRVAPQDFVAGYIAENISRMAVFGGDNGDQLVGGAIANDYAGEIYGMTKMGRPLQVKGVRIPFKLLKDYVTQNNGDFRAVQEWFTKEQRQGGMVERIDLLTFLNHTPRTFRLRGIQFNAAVLGHATLQVVGDGTSVTTPVAAVAP